MISFFILLLAVNVHSSDMLNSDADPETENEIRRAYPLQLYDDGAARETQRIQKLQIDLARVVKRSSSSRNRAKRPNPKKVEDWMSQVTIKTRVTDKDIPTITVTDENGFLVTKTDFDTEYIIDPQTGEKFPKPMKTTSNKLQPLNTLSDHSKSSRTRSRPKRPSTKKVEDWMSQATVTTRVTHKDNPTVTENPTEPETDENGVIVTKPDSTRTSINTEQTSSTKLQPSSTLSDQIKSTTRTRSRPKRPSTKKVEDWMSQATVTTRGTDKDNPTVTENPTEPETDMNGNIVTKPDSTRATTSTEQTSSTKLQPSSTVLDQTSTTRTRKTRPTRPTTVDNKQWEEMLNRTRYTTAKTDTTKEQDEVTTDVSSTDPPKTVRTTLNWEDWLTRYEPKDESSLNPNVTDAAVNVKPDVDVYIYILDEFMKTSSTRSTISTTSNEPQTSESSSETSTTRTTSDEATATDDYSSQSIPSQPETIITSDTVVTETVVVDVSPDIDTYQYLLDHYDSMRPSTGRTETPSDSTIIVTANATIKLPKNSTIYLPTTTTVDATAGATSDATVDANTDDATADATVDANTDDAIVDANTDDATVNATDNATVDASNDNNTNDRDTTSSVLPTDSIIIVTIDGEILVLPENTTIVLPNDDATIVVLPDVIPSTAELTTTTTTKTTVKTTTPEWMEVEWNRDCGNGFYEFQYSTIPSAKEHEYRMFCNSSAIVHGKENGRVVLALLVVFRHEELRPWRYIMNLYHLNSTNFHFYETRTLCKSKVRGDCNEFELKQNTIHYEPSAWRYRLLYNYDTWQSKYPGLDVYLNKSEILQEHPEFEFLRLKSLRSATSAPHRSTLHHLLVLIQLRLIACYF